LGFWKRANSGTGSNPLVDFRLHCSAKPLFGLLQLSARTRPLRTGTKRLILSLGTRPLGGHTRGRLNRQTIALGEIKRPIHERQLFVIESPGFVTGLPGRIGQAMNKSIGASCKKIDEFSLVRR